MKNVRKPKNMKSERFEHCLSEARSYGNAAIWWIKDDFDAAESVKQSFKFARLAARWAMRARGERA